MTEDPRDARRPAPDPLLTQTADYVLNFDPTAGSEAMETARLCLMDSLGCAMLALQFPACTKLLGPVVPGAGMPGGARVPGTGYELDPVRAAFNTGAMIRWLDFNDTWLAVEWGHPSDNLGGILAVADYLSRQGRDIRVRDVLRRMVQAYEIQGVLALENSFNRVGLDHVLLVRVATAAVAAAMLGGGRDEIVNALSNAWIDGAALRTYRHAPNTGPRKSWAAGDATSRGVWLALHCLREETGYPSALSARHWGFQEVLFRGREITLARPMGSYVIENILFKVSYPAEFRGGVLGHRRLLAADGVREGLQIERAVHGHHGDGELPVHAGHEGLEHPLGADPEHLCRLEPVPEPAGRVVLVRVRRVDDPRRIQGHQGRGAAGGVLGCLLRHEGQPRGDPRR